MPRRITDQGEAIKRPTRGPNSPLGATFVKNQVNELIKFEDGTSYKFQTSRETVYDPQVIANLRAVAARHGIFEATNQPAATT